MPQRTERLPLPDGAFAPIVEPILNFVRLQCFTGPDQVKRYYRLFGDLEYDLLTLRAETEAMRLRLREVRRRMQSSATLSVEDEREICVSSHDLTEHMYRKAEDVQNAIARGRAFRYDRAREAQSCLLLADIAAAVVGIADSALRMRERESLTAAIDAYSRLDIATLIDLHDHVQQFVALQRRDHLDPHEEEEWRQKSRAVLARHPLSHAATYDDPKKISERMATLTRRITRQQSRLEYIAMVYLGAVEVARNRN
jgi:hypothetical protein